MSATLIETHTHRVPGTSIKVSDFIKVGDEHFGMAVVSVCNCDGNPGVESIMIEGVEAVDAIIVAFQRLREQMVQYAQAQ